MLLAQPGKVVTRDQLREQIWRDGTFVDFERGLNSAIARLRRALSDSAETPRYVETVSGLGYRFIGALAPLPEAVAAGIPEAPPRRRSAVWWWLAGTAACLVSFTVGLRLHAPPGVPPWKFTRLTSDPGLSGTPALSRDGKLVAYSSDRARGDGPDLYVQQVAGGQPIRLTFDGAGSTTPDFSPDGSKIVFRSNRDGGGIYEIPAFGGQARLLARNGLNPRFSPDGLQVAYWSGAPGVAARVPGTGAIWVVPVAGGQPRRLGAGFTRASFPVWSPDGKYLLLLGYTAKAAFDPSALDWWLVSVNESGVNGTGAYTLPARAGLPTIDDSAILSPRFSSEPRPGCWASNNTIVFSMASGDTSNLWSAEISPKGTAAGALRRLTSGAGGEVEPSCATNDTIAFTSMEPKSQVWSQAFDLNRGKPKGALERITQDLARHESPSFTDDGRYVAFTSAQSGPMNIWLREMTTGQESRVAPSPSVQRYPAVSASGARIAFSSYEGEKRLIYVSTRGVGTQKVCEGCLRATDWSRDEEKLLVFGNRYGIDRFDLVSHRRTPLFEHPAYHLLYGRFSPDNHWASFTARTSPGHAMLVIAPVDGTEPVPESAWIRISDEAPEDSALWSPDGNLLYFTSARDGHTCVWAQRLDEKSHRPAGPAYAVQHLHGRGVFQKLGWSVAGGRITVVLSESTGNIWMMSRSGGIGVPGVRQ